MQDLREFPPVSLPVEVEFCGPEPPVEDVLSQQSILVLYHMTPSGRSAVDRWLLLLFGAGLVLASWLVVPLPSLAFGLPKILILGFVTLIFWAGWCLLLFAVVVPLSLLWSVAPLLSFFGSAPRYEGVLTHMLYVTIALLAMLGATTEEGRRILVKTIVIANVGIVAYGVLQVVSLDPLAFLWGSDVFLGRTFSLIGQPNTLFPSSFSLHGSVPGGGVSQDSSSFCSTSSYSSPPPVAAPSSALASHFCLPRCGCTAVHGF